jgi:predicted exporter
VGAVALLVAAFLARKISFDSDISKMDGVSAQVINNEADFQKTWSRTQNEMALLVVSGKSLDEAEQSNDRLYGLVANRVPEGQFVSLASFWPSAATRHENETRWRTFWTPSRIADVRRDVATAAAPYGFAADAFDPFFDSLTKPASSDASSPILTTVEQQFVATANGETQMLSFFPDTEDNVTSLRSLTKDHPEAQVVSRRALGQAFAESALSENRLLVGVSAAFIVLSLLVLTRSVIKSTIIMLPAIAGVIFMLATLTSLSLAMSVVSIVVAILIMALASDYGVFAAYAWDNNESMLGQGMASMHLSSLSTLAGTASLIFAKHPALHLVGVSMTSGVLSGYLTAFIAIPGACRLLERWKLWRNP